MSFITYTPGEKADYESILDSIHASGPAAIVIVANSIDVARFTQQLRRVDGKTPVIAAEWGASEELIELGGKCVEGIELLMAYENYFSDSNVFPLVERFEERFGKKPSSTTLLTYESVMVLCRAIEKQRGGESLKGSIIRNSPYKGIQGSITINRFGDSIRESTFVIVKNRRFQNSP